jgi:hypothetical protein
MVVSDAGSYLVEWLKYVPCVQTCPPLWSSGQSSRLQIQSHGVSRPLYKRHCVLLWGRYNVYKWTWIVHAHNWLNTILWRGMGSGCVDKWLVTIPGRFNSHEKSPLYQLYRRLDGLQSQSGRRGEGKFITYRDANSDPSAVKPVDSRYNDCADQLRILYRAAYWCTQPAIFQFRTSVIHHPIFFFFKTRRSGDWFLSPSSGRRILFRIVIVILYAIVTNLWIALTCWTSSGDVMCFLWGTNKPIELSCVLNKRQDDE